MSAWLRSIFNIPRLLADISKKEDEIMDMVDEVQASVDKLAVDFAAYKAGVAKAIADAVADAVAADDAAEVATLTAVKDKIDALDAEIVA